MMTARAGQFLLRAPPPPGTAATLPRRLFAAFHDPFAPNYPQTAEQQRDPRPQNGTTVGDPSAVAPSSYPYANNSPFEAPAGPLSTSTYDPSQAGAPYGQFGVADGGASAYCTPPGGAHPGGVPEGPYGGTAYAYQPSVAPFPPYHGASPYAPPPVGGVGYYPPPPMGGPYGMAPTYPGPAQQGQAAWGPSQPQGGAAWGTQGPRGGLQSSPANEGGGPPPSTARERQRQFLSAALLGELDALEAKNSVSLYLQGLNGAKLAGRLGPKEWLYATNVLNELLRPRMQALFSMHFLTREGAQKARDVLANPSPALRQALQIAAGEETAGAASTKGEGPLSLSLYRGLCDDLVSELIFCCAKKVEAYPASTQPSHRVKAVWTEVLLRICPLLGRYEVLQLLQILHGASALANRKVIRDNDLLTLTQAAGALLDQERFVAEVSEAQRARILQEFFRWSIETNAPFAFVRHVAWKSTRLFKLNVRWLSSNETARLLPLICANRVLLSEDELAFFVQVLLKRVSRATPLYAEAQKLSADAAAAALFGVSLNGVDPQRFSGLIVHLLHEAAGLDELPRSQSIVFARLCWALCALKAFDPAVAGDSWEASEAARLLQSAIKRIEADHAASLALLPDILTEVELSKDLLPHFQVPPSLEAAAAEASRVQAALDRRQSRRLHFTLRRALEKLGAEVVPAASQDEETDLGQVQGDGGPGIDVEEQLQRQLPSKKTNPNAGPQAKWVYNEQLGPYNVSFYCPARKLVLEIDDRCLGPSKYVKKRHLESLFKDEGLRVLVVGEHLFQLSRVTGEQGVDILRSAINAAQRADEICPPRHVQLQALLKRVSRQKPKAEEVTAAVAEASTTGTKGQ
ncbi:hypothetical protein cyc_02743 [Cyclospora cayetanensis]|uniref:RAP domain-containing protein n=1 Tax=Cyclospora cayetanensis TaxID=88456 RepID=A0A1D3CU35_9EIME|nr:hypothetical protein cyc_02743 [Cyclospora cayetanensis]